VTLSPGEEARAAAGANAAFACVRASVERLMPLPLMTEPIGHEHLQ
jgi:hypothetical protein